MMRSNNRLKLTAHLANFLSARSLAWALARPSMEDPQIEHNWYVELFINCNRNICGDLANRKEL